MPNVGWRPIHHTWSRMCISPQSHYFNKHFSYLFASQRSPSCWKVHNATTTGMCERFQLYYGVTWGLDLIPSYKFTSFFSQFHPVKAPNHEKNISLKFRLTIFRILSGSLSQKMTNRQSKALGNWSPWSTSPWARNCRYTQATFCRKMNFWEPKLNKTPPTQASRQDTPFRRFLEKAPFP